MRILSLFVTCTALLACGGNKREFPESFDLLGHRVRTPNVAVLIEGNRYDTNGDDEADFAAGAITLLGTSFEGPCDVIASGEPPAGVAGDWFRIDVIVNDLPMEALWEIGQDWTLDALGGREMRFQAISVDAEGNTVLEAGGPPGGRLVLVDHTEFGLALDIEASLGFVAVGADLTSADPIEPLLLEVSELPICPGSSGL